MAEHITHNGTGHEKEEANPRLIVETIVGLTVTVIIVCLIVWGVFNLFKVKYNAEERETAHFGPLQTVPAPRLSANPSEELKELRAREDEILNNYRWVDPKTGVVHIPIEKAMDEVVNKLPTKPQGGASSAKP
jgi:hypothetical protein